MFDCKDAGWFARTLCWFASGWYPVYVQNPLKIAFWIYHREACGFLRLRLRIAAKDPFGLKPCNPISWIASFTSGSIIRLVVCHSSSTPSRFCPHIREADEMKAALSNCISSFISSVCITMLSDHTLPCLSIVSNVSIEVSQQDRGLVSFNPSKNPLVSSTNSGYCGVAFGPYPYMKHKESLQVQRVQLVS